MKWTLLICVVILQACSSEPRISEGPLDWDEVEGVYESTILSPAIMFEKGTIEIVRTSNLTIEINMEDLSDSLNFGNAEARLIENIHGFLFHGVSFKITDDMDTLELVKSFSVKSRKDGKEKKVSGYISACEIDTPGCDYLQLWLEMKSEKVVYSIQASKVR